MKILLGLLLGLGLVVFVSGLLMAGPVLADPDIELNIGSVDSNPTLDLVNNPGGLKYVPDRILVTTAEDVLLLSRDNDSIFRWSLADRSYTNTVPLAEDPVFLAYSGDSNNLFLSYEDKTITKMDLGQVPAPIEEPFVYSAQHICGLSTAGQYLFVCGGYSTWVTHLTYAPDGTQSSEVDTRYYSSEYIWNSNKMYHLRDDISPNDLIYEEIDENGNIGSRIDSPYHSSTGIRHPIRVAPDGSVVILGSGRLFEATSLEQIDALPTAIDDAAWLSGTLYTIEETISGSQVKKWGADYTLTATHNLGGQPLAMFSVSEGLLVVTQYVGRPYFTILDSDLNIVYELLSQQTHLPALLRDYCNNFFDDFSRPTSGWPSGDEYQVRYGYLDGEYQVRSKVAGYVYLFESPSCRRQDYMVGVDARWITSPGSGHGIVIGIRGDYDEYYLFEINTELQMFRVLQRSAGAWRTAVEPTPSETINSGRVVNHLEVMKKGDQLRFHINGPLVTVIHNSGISGRSGGGIASTPYSQQPDSETRFDNFTMADWQGYVDTSLDRVEVNGPGGGIRPIESGETAGIVEWP